MCSAAGGDGSVTSVMIRHNNPQPPPPTPTPAPPLGRMWVPRPCGEYRLPGGWQTDAAAGLPCGGVAGTQRRNHTPSIAFRQLPPNSARFTLRHWRPLYLRAAVQRRGQRSPKASGTNVTVSRSNLAPKHARKHETHPPRMKERVPSRFKRLVLFVLV